MLHLLRIKIYNILFQFYFMYCEPLLTQSHNYSVTNIVIDFNVWLTARSATIITTARLFRKILIRFLSTRSSFFIFLQCYNVACLIKKLDDDDDDDGPRADPGGVQIIDDNWVYAACREL